MHERSNKQELRLDLRQRRKALSKTQRQKASLQLLSQFAALPGWAQCQRVAGYFAADGEIDPEPLLQHLYESGRDTYLPVIREDRSLLFAPWRPGDPLLANKFGIPEPLPEQPRIAADEFDALLIPLVAWDRSGGRLGMGGGFYDRSLGGTKALKIGLAFTIQEVESLPREPWDVAMDFVATESFLHKCRQ